MKVVYVSRSKAGQPNPFVKEQADVLIKNFNVEIQHFLVAKGGIKGYTSAMIQLFKFIKANKVDIIHVHYGLCGLIAVLSNFLFFRKYKVVITFHGCDINKSSERTFSLLGARFSSYNIIVSEKMRKYFKENYSIIPCGIDTDIKLNLREGTRIERGWSKNDFIILFSSGFDRKEKDPEFAFKVIEAFSRTTTRSVKFIELKGLSRTQITELMQAADALIMCSEREGSPQVVKEAIINSLPVVSNDVGDVKSICSGIDNCYIVQKSVGEYVQCLQLISRLNSRIQNRRPVIERFDNNLIAKKIFKVYNEVLE